MTGPVHLPALALVTLLTSTVSAQAPKLSRLPKNYHLSEDGSRFVRARFDNADLYTLDSVPVVELLFPSED